MGNLMAWNQTCSLGAAILARDSRAAVAAIKRGANPSLVIMDRPVLHHAIFMEDAELLGCALAKGAAVDARSPSDGIAPLHLAVATQFIAGVRLLLLYHADVNVKDADHSHTPLLYAMATCNGMIFEMLLRNGADVNANNSEALLHIAVGAQFTAGVQLLLEYHADVNVKDVERCYTPLFYAMATDNRGIFELLLHYGADVNAISNVGYSALHFADRYWKVKGLLEKGAEANVRDNHGITPLDKELANYYNFPERGLKIVTELLRWGAVLDEGSKDAVFLLARDWDCDAELIRKVFLGTGRVADKDENLRTVLHYVAKTGRIDAVQELLRCGACVDARDVEGNTPLHFAVGCNPDFEVVSELIRRGADVNAINNASETPLHKARADSHRVVSQLLFEGADINAQDIHGYTPLHYVTVGTCTWSLLLKHSVLRNYDSRAEYVKTTPWRMDFSYCKQCMAEIEYMKRTPVVRGLSLYDVALGGKWDISFTHEIYKWMATGEFPMYSDVVLPKLAGKVKEYLSDHSINNSLFLEALSRKSNFCTNQHAFLDVVKYLSDDDCLNLYVSSC